MKNAYNFIVNEPDWTRISILVLLVFMFWYLEFFLNIRKPGKWQHLKLNAKFMLLAAPVQMLYGLLLASLLYWCTSHQFGLYYLLGLENSPWIVFWLSFLLLDLGEYVYHRFMHIIPIFWQFHLVHHSDQDLDVSSVLREHPGETFIRLGFLCIFMLLLGIPFEVLVLRQVIQIASNVMGHSNLKLPSKINHFINFVFVTSNSHQVHHLTYQPYTDSNYGDVLTIWDRLFGTFLEPIDLPLGYGLDTYPNRIETDHISKLFILPFLAHREPKLDEN